MTWLAPHDGSLGRPALLSDAATQFFLTIKVLFKLPLRQTTGMVTKVLKLAHMDWAVPDYTTLCRRQKTLAVQIPYRRADGPLSLLVDSTGSSSSAIMPCRGVHANHCRVTNDKRENMAFSADANRCCSGLLVNRERGRKVHLALDRATSDIHAVEFTPSSDGDSPVLPELLDRIPDSE